METFYALMAEQKWADVLELIRNSQSSSKSNKVEWAHICSILEDEFIKYANNEKPVLVAQLCEEYIRLNMAKCIILSDAGIEAIEELGVVSYLDESESAALAFVKVCKYSVTAKKLLDSKVNIACSQKQKSEIKEAKINKFQRTDWLTPLFKSKLEMAFYQALKEVFSSYFIYPNVALSNIFDFKLISPALSKAEEKYYFKAVVDFVVYDPADNHMPKHFFEVDSSYHDNLDAQKRDEKKNNIFAAANIPLIRMRANNDSLTTENDFKIKITEYVRSIAI